MNNKTLEERIEFLERSMKRVSDYVKRKSNEEPVKDGSPYSGLKADVFKDISDIFEEIYSSCNSK